MSSICGGVFWLILYHKSSVGTDDLPGYKAVCVGQKIYCTGNFLGGSEAAERSFLTQGIASLKCQHFVHIRINCPGSHTVYADARWTKLLCESLGKTDNTGL